MFSFFTVGTVLFIIIGSIVIAGVGLTFDGIKNWYQKNEGKGNFWD